MFSFLSQTDHRHMAFEVSELGPRLFEKMLAVKRSQPLRELSSSGCQVTLNQELARYTVVEYGDLRLAIKSGAYDGRDLAVLKYLRKHIGRVGTRVGSALIVAHRYATTVPVFVLREADLTAYLGESRYPASSGSYVAAAVGALFFGMTLPLLAAGLAQWLFPGSTLFTVLLGAVGLALGVYYGWTSAWDMTARQNEAAQALATPTTESQAGTATA